MVRWKMKIKRIENVMTRHETFSKLCGGLLKKAHDLSVLYNAEVGVIVFSSQGKLFQLASTSMQGVLERYFKIQGDSDNNAGISSDIAETDRLTQFTEKLKTLQSNPISDNPHYLSKNLILLEQQIYGIFGRVRAKKDELHLEQLGDINKKVSKIRGTTHATTNILEKLMDISPSKVIGCENSGGRGDVNVAVLKSLLRLMHHLPLG